MIKYGEMLAAANLNEGERDLLRILEKYPAVVRLAAARLAEQNTAAFGLTPRMTDTVYAIRSFIEDYGMSPTMDEIAALTGTQSKGSVHWLVSSLAERGIVKWIPLRPRSIQIIHPAFAPRTGTLADPLK